MLDVGCVEVYFLTPTASYFLYYYTGINTVFAACCLLAFFCFLLLVFNIFNVDGRKF